jgi:WD40 repeat protein
VSSVAVSADGKRIVSGSQDGAVLVWEASSGRKMLSLRGVPVTHLALSRDGQQAYLVCDGDNTISVWDLRAAARHNVGPGPRGAD